MSALLGTLLAKAAPYLLMAGAAIVAFFSVRKAGADKEKAKVLKERVKDISDAKAIDDAIAGRDDTENRKDLGKWSRG